MMKKGFLFLASTLLLNTSLSAQTPLDSAVLRMMEKVVSDSVSRLRDSIRTNAFAVPDTLEPEDDRPARRYLKVSEPSLFAEVSGSVGKDYPMGPGDVLVLTVWGQKQARYDLEVDRDGQVQIPSIGVVSLNGLTFGEARTAIGRRLGASYSGIQTGTTQFDLTLSKLKQVRVFVVGDVKKPGGYLMTGATSVLQAVGLAGGPTAQGSDRIAFVGSGDQKRRVDLYQYLFLGMRPKNDIVRDGEVVRVPPSGGYAEVLGAAARPGRYEILPEETSESLLEIAGGFGPGAAMGSPVNLVRRTTGGTVALLVGDGAVAFGGMTVSPVGDGDVLFVPSRIATRRTSPVIHGGVVRPGTYGWTSGLTVGRLIEMAGGVAPRAFIDRVLIYRGTTIGEGTALRVDLVGASSMPVQPDDSIVVGAPTDSMNEVRTVRIHGAVANPGSYRWAPGMRLKDLLLISGGLQPWADKSQIRIDVLSPQGVPSSKIVAFDGSLLVGGEDPELVAGGIVNVPLVEGWSGRGSVVLNGLVRSPGPIAIAGRRERVSNILGKAGGILPEGHAPGALLFRGLDGRIPFNLAEAIRKPGSDDDIFLYSGDSLHVPHLPATVTVKGEVNRPTTVLYRKGKDWAWYVENAGGMTDSAMSKAVYVVQADGSGSTRPEGLKDPGPGAVVVVPRLVPTPRSTMAQKITAIGTIAGAIASLATAWAIYQTTVDNN